MRYAEFNTKCIYMHKMHACTYICIICLKKRLDNCEYAIITNKTAKGRKKSTH